jgi:hypothetical protein
MDYSMSYDILKEMETRICGRYIAWSNNTEDPEKKKYWRDQARRITREVYQVQADDPQAVATKRAELRKLFHNMPIEAPA